jgi:putative endonuclease
MRDRPCYVYILTNAGRMSYIGVTSHFERRFWEHKTNVIPGFTQKYNVKRPVYYEMFGDICPAIAREKEIKGWRREKKIALIKPLNPTWRDLSEDWIQRRSQNNG